jgi:hypothetical protein
MKAYLFDIEDWIYSGEYLNGGQLLIAGITS